MKSLITLKVTEMELAPRTKVFERCFLTSLLNCFIYYFSHCFGCCSLFKDASATFSVVSSPATGTHCKDKKKKNRYIKIGRVLV